ncbi:MAG: baseplate J/gp47 family protein [Cypionkella sp.]
MARAESFLDDRRERLAHSGADVNGIAGIEVDPADMTRLTLRMVFPLAGQANGVPAAGVPLAAADLSITGGDRVRTIGIVSATATGTDLALRVTEAGDFSTYTLRIDDTVPGYDPILREVRFAFRLNCDTGDCAIPPASPGDPVAEPRLDYLARDFESYRAMMLDRMAVTVPDWTERNLADTGVTLVEWLAYIGDALSYRLDQVATEYSLDTARLRTSAARHARLTGYRMHNGVSARVLAQVQLAAGVASLNLPPDAAAFVTRTSTDAAPVIDFARAETAITTGAVAFEPLYATTLHAGNHRIALHHWGDPDAVLGRGASSAYLRDPDANVTLQAGDFLVLVQARDPVTGRAADAAPNARQAVRLTAAPQVLADPLELVPPPGGGAPVPLRVLRVTWGVEEALTFDLTHGLRPAGEPPMAEAYGNLVLADHGLTLRTPETLTRTPNGLAVAPDMTDPEAPPAPGAPDERKTLAELDRPRPFHPSLQRRDLSFAVRPEAMASGSAASHLRLNPAEARAGISLTSVLEPDLWWPVPDLLGQPANALVFVPEVESDGTTRLRFGQASGTTPSLAGKTPLPGDIFAATYRVGGGRLGNIGAGALTHVAASGLVRAQIAGVENPMPAVGGMPRETVAEVRQRAPVAFNIQHRAVTLADYEALLTARPDIQRAQARKRWIGSWSAIFLSVDRIDNLAVDAAFRQELLDYLEPYRMMGHDLSIDAPILVPLSLTIVACATPDAFADAVAEALADRFSSGLMTNGQRAFFHPDNVTFASAIYLSRIYEAALQVPGVKDVRVSTFGRDGAASALDDGVLRFGPREIPVLSNNPNRPSEGRLTITAEGGR